MLIKKKKPRAPAEPTLSVQTSLNETEMKSINEEESQWAIVDLINENDELKSNLDIFDLKSDRLKDVVSEKKEMKYSERASKSL